MGFVRGIVALGAILITILATYTAYDPYHLSILSGVPNFQAQYVRPPPYNPIKNMVRDGDNKLQNSTLIGHGQIFGPESVAFDVQGKGPYSGLSDGRVVCYDGPEKGWNTFATTTNTRPSICDYKHVPFPQLASEHACGRPLGLRFHKQTGELYIADAYFGIVKVGPQGGVAQSVIPGESFKFCNDLDFDHDGNLYFTDSSTKYHRRQFFLSRLELENTGRFLKYNPVTKEVTVLVQGLRFPNGVAMSKDGTFVVIAETNMARLLKYWLKGPKAHTWEVWKDLPGIPDNVRRNENGDFWVALNGRRTWVEMMSGKAPWVRYAIAKLPIPRTWFSAIIKHMGYAPKPHGLIQKYSLDGELLETLEDHLGTVVKAVSEVEEHDGKLYIGSVMFPNVAIYALPTHTNYF